MLEPTNYETDYSFICQKKRDQIGRSDHNTRQNNGLIGSQNKYIRSSIKTVSHSTYLEIMSNEIVRFNEKTI